MKKKFVRGKNYRIPKDDKVKVEEYTKGRTKITHNIKSNKAVASRDEHGFIAKARPVNIAVCNCFNIFKNIGMQMAFYFIIHTLAPLLQSF